jgi:hypothetical protein
MIRLETSRRTGIRNNQGFEISAFNRNWSESLPKDFPYAIRRTGMSALYNCHGLTFACRRTRIEDSAEIQRILSDDAWTEIDIRNTLPGDIVVYFSEDGDANHSGLVVEIEPSLGLPRIISKWGHAGEFIHRLSDCPQMYGPIQKFYRCRL